MKKLILSTVAVLAASPAFAHHTGGTTVEGTIKNHFRTQIVRVPHTVQICEQQQGADAGDVLGGMIIGGVFGKALSGNDQGAGVGAVIGGMIAAEENQGSTNTVCRNQTTYTEETRETYTHSTMEFWLDGKKFIVNFNRGW